MPITWRNVSGGSDAASVRLMENAGQSFDGMFEGLGNVLDTKNQQLKTQDTEAFKQLLAQRYGNDPMALQQAQQSGELGSLRERFKYLDREQTGTDAINEMVSGLQERALQDQAYQDNQMQVGNRDARTQILRDIAAGNLDQAEEAIGANQWVDSSDLITALGSARQQQADNQYRQQNLALRRRQDARAAEEHNYTMEERQRLAAEREAQERQEDLINSTFAEATRPLAEGETYTQRKQALAELLKSDRFKFMKPGERQKLIKQSQEVLSYGEAVAQGDQEDAEKYIAPVRKQVEQSRFYAAENREEDEGALATQIFDRLMAESEDSGLKQILAEGDANDRLAIMQGIQNALTGYKPDGTRFFEGNVPMSDVLMAASAVKGEGLTNFDKSFGDQLEKVITNGGFTDAYERYTNSRTQLQQMQQQLPAAARDGALARIGQGSTGGNGPAPGSAAERQRQQEIREDTGIPQPQNQNQPGGAGDGSDVEPSLPNGDEQTAEDPFNRSNTPSPVPAFEPEDRGSLGAGTPLREWIPNAFTAITNAIGSNQQKTREKTFREVTGMLESGTIDANNRQRLNLLMRTNPSLLKNMSKQQRNKLRDILGEGMINRLMKQTE